MEYLSYIVAAYAVFVVVLGWDFVAGHWQVRRELRQARARAARAASAAARPRSGELSR